MSILKRRFLFVNHEDHRVWNSKGMFVLCLSIDVSAKLCSVVLITEYIWCRLSLSTANSDNSDSGFTFFDSLLDKATAILAAEHDAVCIFVNDIWWNCFTKAERTWGSTSKVLLSSIALIIFCINMSLFDVQVTITLTSTLLPSSVSRLFVYLHTLLRQLPSLLSGWCRL